MPARSFKDSEPTDTPMPPGWSNVDPGDAQAEPLPPTEEPPRAPIPPGESNVEPGDPAAGPVAPTVASLTPNTAQIGAPDFTLHVIGTGFTVDSVIVFNGFDEPTTLVSDTEVTTGVDMSVWTGPSAPLPVSVRNGTAVSNELPFTFTAAAR